MWVKSYNWYINFIELYLIKYGMGVSGISEYVCLYINIKL